MSDLSMYKERKQHTIHIEEEKELQKDKRSIKTSSPDGGAIPENLGNIEKERDVIKLMEQESMELTRENVGDARFMTQPKEGQKDPVIAKTESKNINALSSTGSQNLHRINNGMEPKINNKYVD